MMMFAPLFDVWLTQVPTMSSPVAVLAKITLGLALAWVAHFLLAYANPRWRVLVWRCLAIGLVLIPAAHYLTPPIKLPAVNQIVQSPSSEADIPPVSSEDASNIRTFIAATANDVALQNSYSWEADGRRTAISWSWVLLSVWLLGASGGLLRVFVGVNHLRRMVRESEQVPSSVARVFLQVSEELQTRAGVDVRISKRISAPILCGIDRKTILLPTSMTHPSRANALPGVFSHELSHVNNRDLTWNLILHIVSAVLWFHPLAWFSRSAHAAACEAVCDCVAANFLGNVADYGKILARVALDAAASPKLSLAMARSSNVTSRLNALHRRVFRQPLRKPLFAAAITLSLLSAITIGGLKTARAQASADAATADANATQAANDKRAALVTKETEAAANKGLAFLAARQREDGSFGSDKVAYHDPAFTALCGLAFMAAGSEPGKGPYGVHLEKARDYIVNHVQADGFIGVRPGAGSMYVHAYALRFLADAHRARPTARTKNALAKATKFVVEYQNASDGWRYSPKSLDADSNVTSCLVSALQAAKQAGATVPDETIERASKYLLKCQLPNGAFSYTLPPRPTKADVPRTAAVMAALQPSKADPMLLKKGSTYLNNHAAEATPSTHYYYFAQFHLGSVMRYAKDADFQRWYDPSSKALLKQQADDGSWQLANYPPDYPTAQACIALLSPRLTAISIETGTPSGDSE